MDLAISVNGGGDYGIAALAAALARRLSKFCSRRLTASSAAASNAARASPWRPSFCSREARTAEFWPRMHPDGPEKMIFFQRWLARQPVHDFERGLRALGHADGDRTVEFDHRRIHQPRERRIERGDARPVGRLHRRRLGVAGGDAPLAREETPGAG